MEEKKDKTMSLQIADEDNLGISLIELNATKAIELANRRVDFFKQIKTVSLRMTTHKDWVDQQGKPYLQGTGVEKLTSLWGIYIKNDVKIETIPDGKLYYCRCSGTIGSKVTGGEGFFIGGRSANDSWFFKQKQLDKMDVEKAAYTNFEVNGITRLLGLRGLSWDELKMAGIEKRKTSRIDYKKGKDGGETIPQELLNLRIQIANATLAYCSGDIDAAKEMLENFIGSKDTKDIKTIKQAKEVLSDIKKMVKKEEEENQPIQEAEIVEDDPK